MPTKKKTKKTKSKKTNGVRKNGKMLYGAVAQAILKKRAAAKRRAAAKGKVNPKPAKKRAAKKASTKPNPKKAATAKAKPSKKRAMPRKNGFFSGVADKAERVAKWAKTRTFNVSALDYGRASKRVFKVRATSGEEATRLAQSQHGTERYGKYKVNPLRGVASKVHSPKRRNPAGELYEMFTGQPSTGSVKVQVPTGAPHNLDQLGDFVEFKWCGADSQRHTVNLEEQGIPGVLAAHQYDDGRFELVLASAPGQKLANFRDALPPGDHGYIYEVTYRAQKAHLADAKPQLYYHKLGEETGKPPIFHINKEGELIFKGGEYWIESSGIHN